MLLGTVYVLLFFTGCSSLFLLAVYLEGEYRASVKMWLTITTALFLSISLWTCLAFLNNYEVSKSYIDIHTVDLGNGRSVQVYFSEDGEYQGSVKGSVDPNVYKVLKTKYNRYSLGVDFSEHPVEYEVVKK